MMVWLSEKDSVCCTLFHFLYFPLAARVTQLDGFKIKDKVAKTVASTFLFAKCCMKELFTVPRESVINILHSDFKVSNTWPVDG